MQRRDGSTFLWEFVHPLKLLAQAIEDSPALAALYARAIAEKPPSMQQPWRLILGWDEFVPGNKLRVDNRRKCMNLSFNFLELGPAALCQDWTWLTPVCVRSSVLREVEGGWSCMLRQFLRLLLLSPSGLCTAGVPLLLGGEPKLLHARVSVMLSDGDGQRLAWDWKGSASLKPCFRHFNVFKKNSDLAHRRAGYVEITCHDPMAFSRMPTPDLFVAVDALVLAQRRVQERTMTKRRLEDLERAHGLNANPDGILADFVLRPYVDPISAMAYDWVHTFLQDGTFTVEAFEFLRSAEAHGVRASDIRTFLKDESWSFPAASRAKAKVLHRVFDEYRSQSSQEAEKLKCTASELLGLYGLLRHFIETRVGDHADLAAKRASFQAACSCLDLILFAKRGLASCDEVAPRLLQASCRHLQLHIAAYGHSHIKPKHHWALDIADQIRDHDCVLDAFIIERIHLQVKVVAEHVRNTTRFERSVLSGVLNNQLRRASQASDVAGLRGPSAHLPGSLGVQVAARLEWLALQATCPSRKHPDNGRRKTRKSTWIPQTQITYGCRNHTQKHIHSRVGVHPKVSVGDIVFRIGVAGQVVACCLAGPDLCVLVHLLAQPAAVSEHSATWRPTDAREVWLASEVEQCLAWSTTVEGRVLVVRR